MSWAAVSMVGIGTVTSLIQGDSAKNAANQQNQAANRANAMAMTQFNQTREDQAPWREAGGRALAGMENGDFQRDFRMEDYQQDPGYQFRMKEGMKALEGSAAARGNLNSGATMKALTRYGQGVASEEYSNAYNRFNNDRTLRFNRLSSLAGLGQTANSQVGAAGQNYANAYGQNTMAGANASSAASIAQGNAINSAVGTGANMYMMSQMSRPQQQIAPPGGGSVGGGGGMFPTNAQHKAGRSNDYRVGNDQLAQGEQGMDYSAPRQFEQKRR